MDCFIFYRLFPFVSSCLLAEAWKLNNTLLAQNSNNNTLSGNLFENNNLFNQNQSVWNKNQYQTPTPWTKQSASFGNNLSTQTKPVYENPNPRRYSTGEILWDGVKGFGQGALGGLERGINSATYGLYDFVSDLADNGGYERR